MHPVSFLGMLPITFSRMLDSLIVEAVMIEEVGILTTHYSQRHVGGYLLERNPVVRELEIPTLPDLLRTADKHEGCKINWDKTERHHRKNSGAEEGYQYPAYDGAQFLKNQMHVLLSSLCIGILDHLL